MSPENDSAERDQTKEFDGFVRQWKSKEIYPRLDLILDVEDLLSPEQILGKEVRDEKQERKVIYQLNDQVTACLRIEQATVAVYPKEVSTSLLSCQANREEHDRFHRVSTVDHRQGDTVTSTGENDQLEWRSMEILRQHETNSIDQWIRTRRSTLDQGSSFYATNRSVQDESVLDSA